MSTGGKSRQTDLGCKRNAYSPEEETQTQGEKTNRKKVKNNPARNNSQKGYFIFLLYIKKSIYIFKTKNFKMAPF